MVSYFAERLGEGREILEQKFYHYTLNNRNQRYGHFRVYVYYENHHQILEIFLLKEKSGFPLK